MPTDAYGRSRDLARARTGWWKRPHLIDEYADDPKHVTQEAGKAGKLDRAVCGAPDPLACRALDPLSVVIAIRPASVSLRRHMVPGRSCVDYLGRSFCSALAVAASAGNVNSIESSEVVTSIAVPNVATVAKKTLVTVGGIKPHKQCEDLTCGRVGGPTVLVLGRRVVRHLLQQRGETCVPGDRDLTCQPPEEICAHLAQVDSPGEKPPRVQADPHHIDRKLQQRRVDPRGQRRHRGVGGDQVPAAVDDDRGVGLLRGEDQIERLADLRQLGVSYRVLGDRRGIAGGEQQLIALPDRDFELLGERSAPYLGTRHQRPVSTKLRCRGKIPASRAKSSWVRRRRLRHSLSSGPTRGWELVVAILVQPTLVFTRSPRGFPPR